MLPGFIVGLVAEWLRRGLQILAPRFDSGRGLQLINDLQGAGRGLSGDSNRELLRESDADAEGRSKHYRYELDAASSGVLASKMRSPG